MVVCKGMASAARGWGIIAAFDILLLLSTRSVAIHILFDQRNYCGLMISWMISVHTLLLRFLSETVNGRATRICVGCTVT